ncbi:hypothetical protein ABZ777_32565 [Micromonospora parva]|uniref:hypothetical protein n=1 Tax=Micromonospora parva TaxID=1464048 RepID=UPI0033F80D03
MTRARHLLIPTLLLAAALTGCSSNDEPAAAASAATTTAAASSAPPVDGGTYDTPLLLVDALKKGGVDCTGYSAIAQPTGAVARGNCHVAGEEYTIGIYASAADARAQPNNMVELLDGVSDVDMVLGRNWTIGTPDEPSARKVAGILGGEVFHQDA